ncbi:MAG: hypothetical protein ACXVLQ_10365 [Bacteriovorax sp.]
MTKIPNHLSDKILGEIKARILPDIKIILVKVLAIHVLTAVLTLSICPQFGFSLFKTGINLMDVFMKIGPHFCDFACGIFFTSASVTTILLALSRDEIRVLRFRPFLMASTMVLTSLGFFLMLNPGLFVQVTLLWFVGAVLGTAASLEMGFQILKRS